MASSPQSRAATAPRQPQEARQIGPEVQAAIVAAVTAALAASAAAQALEAAGYTAARLAGALVALLRPLAVVRIGLVARSIEQRWNDVFPTAGPRPDIWREIMGQEMEYEREFARRSAKRVVASMERAARRGDDLDAAFQRAMAREARFERMRQAAVIRRVTLRVEEEWVRDRSPEGAYWIMDPTKRIHTADCKAMANKAWSWPVLAIIRPSNRHNLCFASGTLVVSPSTVMATTSRRYSGDMVQITTPLGGDLTVTPNHPILTTKGWVAAGLIDGSHDLVYASGGQTAMLCDDPDNQQGPSRIEDVRASTDGLGGVVSASVPLSAMDFHGDARDGDVAVVSTDGSLVADVEAPLDQRLSNLPLDVGDPVVRVALSSLCYSSTLFDGAGASSSSLVGFLNLRLSLLWCHGGCDESGGLAGPSQGNAGAYEAARDRGSRYSELLRETLDAGSAKVLLNDLGDGKLSSYRPKRIIRISGWEGHVHNLHTRDGWYLAEGIVAHNCGCRLLPLDMARANGLPNTNMVRSAPPRVALLPHR